MSDFKRIKKKPRAAAKPPRKEIKMTIYGRKITDEDMLNIASYMDDEIREHLNFELAPCTNEEYIAAYIEQDPELLDILKNEFDFDPDGDEDRAEIEALAEEIRDADTWTDDLLDKLRELAEIAGLDSDNYAEPYELCIDIQKALDIDLGE